MSLPFIQELTQPPSVPQALRALADREGIALLDSSLQRGELGRYSFLMAEPFEQFRLDHPEYRQDPFAEIRKRMNGLAASTIKGLPPFQGGAAGVLGYELGRCFERLPELPDDFDLPVIMIGLYSWVLAWDHQQQRCWYIDHGFPEETASSRLQLAKSRWESISRALAAETLPTDRDWCDDRSTHCDRIEAAYRKMVPLEQTPAVRSNFSREGYLQAVQAVIDKIFAGDIFQANLSQRFLTPATRSPIEQYLKLRQQNPATFAGYLAFDDWAILSSSPERFLRLHGKQVSTRPIKGTRGRRPRPEEDLFSQDELRESNKDRAENVMIVDLLRNDLSRVCLPGSIQVTELCNVEVYETVSHLVSEVCGTLREEFTFWDLLGATFPGGSITGAPKIRAMEIISEQEQIARGPYCGSLFYLGFDGTADSNILIRTMTQRKGWLTFSAGGGIVSRSVPEEEYAETLHKARGMINSLSPGPESK